MGLPIGFEISGREVNVCTAAPELLEQLPTAENVIVRGVDRDCKYSFSLMTEKRGAVPSEFLLELWVVSAK